MGGLARGPHHGVGAVTTCAFCGYRDATATTEHDGRLVPTCGVCYTPPPKPRFRSSPHRPSPRRPSRPRLKLLAAVERIGPATARQIAEAADARIRGANGVLLARVRARLLKAHRSGLIVAAPIDPARPWIGNLYDVRREDRKESA